MCCSAVPMTLSAKRWIVIFIFKNKFDNFPKQFLVLYITSNNTHIWNNRTTFNLYDILIVTICCFILKYTKWQKLFYQLLAKLANLSARWDDTYFWMQPFFFAFVEFFFCFFVFYFVYIRKWICITQQVNKFAYFVNKQMHIGVIYNFMNFIINVGVIAIHFYSSINLNHLRDTSIVTVELYGTELLS